MAGLSAQSGAISIDESSLSITGGIVPAKRTANKKKVPGGARKRKGGFPCPDCDFIAKHAMGLGRHRSTRHGVVSKRRQRMAGASVAWIPREQAATRAGVHYNTIRQWEQAGTLRRSKRQGARGALVSVVDLNRILAQRGAAPSAVPGVEAAQLAALEARFAHLVDGLEALLVSLKGPAPRRRGPAKIADASKAATRKTAPKAKAKAKAKRKPAAKRSAKTRRRT